MLHLRSYEKKPIRQIYMYKLQLQDPVCFVAAVRFSVWCSFGATPLLLYTHVFLTLSPEQPDAKMANGTCCHSCLTFLRLFFTHTINLFTFKSYYRLILVSLRCKNYLMTAFFDKYHTNISLLTFVHLPVTQIWKPPNIPKPHCVTQQRQQEVKPPRPITTLLVLVNPVNLFPAVCRLLTC